MPTQILTLAAEARTLTDILRSRVAELETLSTTDKLGAESISAVLGAYQRQLQHTGQLLIAIAKLGLEDRRTRVAEENVQRVADSACHRGGSQAGPVFRHPAATYSPSSRRRSNALTVNRTHLVEIRLPLKLAIRPPAGVTSAVADVTESRCGNGTPKGVRVHPSIDAEQLEGQGPRRSGSRHSGLLPG